MINGMRYWVQRKFEDWFCGQRSQVRQGNVDLYLIRRETVKTNGYGCMDVVFCRESLGMWINRDLNWTRPSSIFT